MPPESAAPKNSKTQTNYSWNNAIPLANWAAMIISLLLVFGLDASIILKDPTLTSYWRMMLAVFFAFSVFFFFENFLFRQIFKQTKFSFLDILFILLIIFRNTVFVLNFLPFIQLIGLVIISKISVPFILVYLLLLSIRLKQARAQLPNS